MVVTTRRRAAANKDNNVPVKEAPIRNDTKAKRSTRTKNAQPLTVDQRDTSKSVTGLPTEITPEPKSKSMPASTIEGSDEDDNVDGDSSSDDNDSSDDDQENTSDEDDSDDDLDDLLKKAQTALQKQRDSIIKLDDVQTSPVNLQLPKLEPGVSVDDELYIKPTKDGIAKLSSQVVAVVDADDKSDQDTKNGNTLVTLKKIKQEDKPLSRKERQLEREKTAGKGWFDMPLADVTPEIKRDLQILRMRHVLDRKRHYKKLGKGPDPKYFQMGTVIEGATEFFSSRINKKDRKRTFAEEILANDNHTDYYYRKYQESQERKSSGGKKHFKKRMLKRSS